MRHEAFHSLHHTILSAEVEVLAAATLIAIPGQQREAFRRLTIFMAMLFLQDRHPPMIRLAFFLAADITTERQVPCHTILPEQAALLV